MTEQTKNIELQEGDLVLMNFAGLSEKGPVFEMLEKVGTLTDEADTSLQENSISEHGTGEGTSLPKPDTPDPHYIPKAESSPSVIGVLVAQRDILNDLIRQMTQDAAGTKTEQSPAGRRIPPHDDSSAHAGRPSKTQPRELPRERDQSPIHH